MANHEFGIIQNQPMSKEKFYEYEPNKYSCIAVDDNFIEPILIDLQNVDCYWHTLQNPGRSHSSKEHHKIDSSSSIHSIPFPRIS